ncbi:MAG TPA: phosphoribosylformylglycinamidine synthase subunit PurS [Mycobacteriales bacterium]|jgi:phosphoribosylformylglycinamidine synthase|nr:phosphoribosylformylglycinamidine synthase subunit PurS [Mycobacteriales bacterium]
MAQVVVDVMPKSELLDPQGQAIADALPGLGCPGVRNVRQGKRFELETEGELTDEQRQNIERVAGTLLTNPVIENYTLRVVSDRSAAGSPA